VDGTPTAWCAQHDEKTFRAGEGAELRAAVDQRFGERGIVEYLMEIENPSPEVRKAIESAVRGSRRRRLRAGRFSASGPQKPAGRGDVVMVEDATAGRFGGGFTTSRRASRFT
jgi:PelA/Pel-15E family pectate lyase